MAIQIHSLERVLSANLTWNKARIKLLARLLVALVQVRTVNLAQLASVLQSEALIESNYKRLQRFFRFFQMPYADLACLTVKILKIKKPWILTLDRTEWHCASHKYNILVLGIAYRGVAIPVIFHVLPKIGTCSYAQRRAVVDEFLQLFGAEAIDYLVADREFHGRRWYQYLKKHQIRFCLRARKDTPLTDADGKMRKMGAMIARQAVGVKYQWHQPWSIWKVEVKLVSLRLSSDEWLIIVASPELGIDLFQAYAVRWEIETCFGCLKSRGFCLEATRLEHAERVRSLLAVLVLCLCWAIKTGEWISKKRPLRKSSHGRLTKSLFRVGLDGLRQVLCSFNKSNQIISYRHIVYFLSCT